MFGDERFLRDCENAIGLLMEDHVSIPGYIADTAVQREESAFERFSAYMEVQPWVSR